MNDDEEVVGLCSECSTQQTDRHMYNSAHAQAGSSAVCKYCKGVVVICRKIDRDKVLNAINIKRGIR